MGSFNLTAGTNTSSSQSSSQTSSQTGSISTTGSASLGISQQKSSAQRQGNTYTNSELNVGELNGYAGTTNLTGGRINAGGGDYATGKLNIETVQDSASSSNKSSGGNLGINFSGGVPSGGSIGANKANGSSQSLIATEQSGIVYNDDNHSLTAGSTTNIGGIIAKIQTDNDGNQTNGTLNFTTGSLTTKDLINTATEDQRSIGGSLSVGSTPTGKSLNNIGIQLGNTGQEFESETLATIGQGAVVTGDALTRQDSLAGVNRDGLGTEIIIKDIQTGGLDVDANIDGRVFTHDGRTEIIQEQKKLPKNIKGNLAITGTAGLAVPSIAAGLLDNGNSNPDSLNKSGIDKAKDNFKQLTNNLEVGMSDNRVNLAAKVEAIQEGELTNSIDNQDTLNNFNTAITEGTDADGTKISLVDDPRNVDGIRVRGTTNVDTGQDTFIDTGSMSSVVEVINHEAAHQNGQGEVAADVMGQTGNSAFDLGKWANSGAIAEERTTITPRPITSTNDAKAQQEQLASNKEKLEAQQEAGDAFENEASYRCNSDGKCSHASDRYSAQGQAEQTYPNDKKKRDAYIAAHEASKGTGVKNIVKSVVAFATNPDIVITDSVKGVAQAILSPIDTTIAINNAIEKWQADYEKAKLTNPALAGRMQGELSSILGTEAVIALTTGSAGSLARAVKVANQASVEVRNNKPSRDNPINNSNGNADYNASNGNNNSNNKSNSQNINTIGNDNYFDNVNYADLSEYGVDSPNSLDQFNAEQAVKRKAYEVDKKAQQDEFDASMAEIDASIDEINKSIKADADRRAADVRVNDKIAEADRIKEEFERSKANEATNVNDALNYISVGNQVTYNGVGDPLFQPPEHPDYPITSYVVPDDGLTVNMAIHKDQINPDTGQVDINLLGGFTTRNEILDVDQVHSDLAVKSPDWGPEKTHVQQIQIQPGTRVQESVVGPQTGVDGKIYEGGGNQVEPLVDRSERSNIMVPIGNAIPLPKRQ